VFGLNNGGSIVDRPDGCKCYYLKILDNGVLVRDYVPVRVGDTGELFDRVTGTYATRSGTFVLGPDTFQQGVLPTRMMAMGVRKKGLIPAEFTEVEYIQNTGSSTSTDSDYSWVDTGITPKSDTIIESRHVLISAINYYPGFYGSATS
jgi:hypothetical protein